MTLNDIGSRRNGGLLVIGFTTDESTANKIPEYISSSERLVSSYLELQSYLEIQPPSFPGFSARYQKKRTTRMCIIRDELNTSKESGSVKKKETYSRMSHFLFIFFSYNTRVTKDSCYLSEIILRRFTRCTQLLYVHGPAKLPPLIPPRVLLV